jgi:hypothetical protein
VKNNERNKQTNTEIKNKEGRTGEDFDKKGARKEKGVH